MKVYLKDIVLGTSTNIEGVALFCFLDQKIKSGECIQLSFKDSSPISSSFFNSSIGELVEKYGMNTFKSSVSMVECSKFQVSIIRQYLNNMNNCQLDC